MSEQWVELSAGDVLGVDHPERVLITKIKGADDLQSKCDEAVEEIRQAYEISGRALGGEGTIPSGLKRRAIAMALWRYVSEGVPSLPKTQTRDRREAADEASRFVIKIASAEVTHISGPSVRPRRRQFK